MVVEALLKDQTNLIMDVANSGFEAIEMFQHNHYDAILMDCQMPQMDGFETTMRMRKFEEDSNMRSSIPIIALTANAQASDRQRCFASGMNDFLSKPFQQHEMIEILSCWLDKE